MPCLSKQKTLRTTSSGLSSNGRLFCITGVEKTCLNGVATVTTSLIGQSDTESKTSGYLSSLESSGEYFLDESDRATDTKPRLGHDDARIPNTSTPKQDSETQRPLFKYVTNKVTNKKAHSMLSIKRNFSKSTENVPVEADSFWDIKTPRKALRSTSQSDVNRKERRQIELRRNSAKTLSSHDIDMISKNRNLKSQDWKRRPYLTQSDSYLDSRLYKADSTNKLTEPVSKSQSFGALPRYRVKFELDPVVTKNKLIEPRDGIVSVDESMGEFLTSVDRDNFASFLMFYDKVTHSSRNPNAHDAVYF